MMHSLSSSSLSTSLIDPEKVNSNQISNTEKYKNGTEKDADLINLEEGQTVKNKNDVIETNIDDDAEKQQTTINSHAVVIKPKDNQQSNAITSQGSYTLTLFKLILSVSPNDIVNALCVMVASSFMAKLHDLSADDAGSVGAICATAYTVARVVGSCHQIAAVFTVQGVTVHENQDNSIHIEIDQPLLKQSLIQLIKIGLIDSTLAAIFLYFVPSIYRALGTASNITDISQDFVNIAIISLYPQILNIGLQQTLFKMDKLKQLVRGALVYLTTTLGSLLLFQLTWGPLKQVQNIALSFVIGTFATLAFYTWYLIHKGYIFNPNDFWHNLFRDPNSIFYNLFHNGNPIAIQLTSELFAVILMPIMATQLINKNYIDDALSILNFTNIINLTAAVLTITLAQAGSNLMDSLVRLYKKEHNDRHLDAIRHVVHITLRAGLIYNWLLMLGLVPAAYPIASLFYNPQDITMPGISQNPWILASILAVGLLINSRRDLCIFMLRSVNIFGLAAFSSITALWVINIPVAIALCTAPWNLNVVGILLAYYAVGIPLGALFLRHKLGQAISAENLPQLLSDDKAESDQAAAKINRILPAMPAIPSWCRCTLWGAVNEQQKPIRTSVENGEFTL